MKRIGLRKTERDERKITRERERETDRQRQKYSLTGRERETDRQTHIQIDRQSEKREREREDVHRHTSDTKTVQAEYNEFQLTRIEQKKVCLKGSKQKLKTKIPAGKIILLCKHIDLHKADDARQTKHKKTKHRSLYTKTKSL